MSFSRLPSGMGNPPEKQEIEAAFWELCQVVARLRAPDGCPWDRQQTLESIKPHTLEETYELLEAIDSGDDVAIADELGDVLLQVVLDSQIAADEQRFGLVDVVQGLTAKLIRRHPHVFGTETVDSADEVKLTWERVKQGERKRPKESLLDGLPVALPALARAARLQEKAAKVGYDFPCRDMLFEKLNEEISELKEEIYGGDVPPEVPISLDVEPIADLDIDDLDLKCRVEGELGDVLFVLANIARRWKINPEEALRKSNAKFQRRFRAIEAGLKQAGKEITDSSLEEMEYHYQQEKKREREQGLADAQRSAVEE